MCSVALLLHKCNEGIIFIPLYYGRGHTSVLLEVVNMCLCSEGKELSVDVDDTEA